jgi:hypothetical protein
MIHRITVLCMWFAEVEVFICSCSGRCNMGPIYVKDSSAAFCVAALTAKPQISINLLIFNCICDSLSLFVEVKRAVHIP